MDKRIIITGAGGFIGFHLSKLLINKGYDILGLDNINDYYDINLKLGRLNELGIDLKNTKNEKSIKSSKYKNFTFCKCSLEDSSDINQIFEKKQPQIVVNLAAQAGVRYSLKYPEKYISSNIVGFFNIIEASKNLGVENFIYASSSSVYGLNSNIPFSINDNVDHPISIYAASKKSNELIAHTYSHLYNIPTTGLRFFTVYGPWGRPDMALFKFTKSIFEGKEIDVYNNGNMMRDFTYIDDIIEGINATIENPSRPNPNWDSENPCSSTSKAPYRIYNIGNSSPVNLLDFIKILEKEIKLPAKINFLPIQPGDVLETYADVSELRNEFNYFPKTNLEKGVKEFVAWYRSFYLQ